MAKLAGKTYAEAVPADNKLALLDQIESRMVSGMVVSYIKEEPVLFDNEAGGMTVGQKVDRMIADAISAGDRISSFTIHVTERDWNIWRS